MIDNNASSQIDRVGGSGGGVYFGNGSNAVMKNSTVQDNTASGYRGGGICIDDSNITLNNVVIKNNAGGNYGGGISVWSSTITLTDVSLSGNSVGGVNGLGGGVFSLASVQILTTVSLIGNSASKQGAGVYSVGIDPITGSYTGGDVKVVLP